MLEDVKLDRFSGFCHGCGYLLNHHLLFLYLRTVLIVGRYGDTQRDRIPRLQRGIGVICFFAGFWMT